MNLKKILISLYSILFLASGVKADVAGTWIEHPALDIYSCLYSSGYCNITDATNNVQKLVEGERYVYALISGGLYMNPSNADIAYSETPFVLARYDKTDPDGRFTPLKPYLPVSGTGVTALEYSQQARCMAVAYDNGCFDLIYDSGRIVSNTDLSNYNPAGSTSVRSISFSADGKKAVMATDYGILIADMITANIDHMLDFTHKVDFANLFGKNVIASSDGIFRIFPLDNPPLKINDARPLKSSADKSPAALLSDGAVKARFGIYPVTSDSFFFLAPPLTNVDGVSMNILTLPENPLEEECRVTNFTSISCNYASLGAREDVAPSFRELSLITPTKEGWMVHNQASVYLFNVAGKEIDFSSSDTEKKFISDNYQTLRKDQTAAKDHQAGPVSYKTCATYDGKNFWIFNPRQGFYQKSAEGSDAAAVWSEAGATVELNAMAAGMPRYLYYSPRYGLIVRNNGHEVSFSNDWGQADGLSSYKDGVWTIHTLSKTNFSPGFITTGKSNLMGHTCGDVPDPVFPQYVYQRGETTGFLRHNLEDHSDLMLFTRANYNPANFSNKVTVTPQITGSVYNSAVRFSEFGFDNDGTLWTTFCRLESNIGPTQGELWYWTAEDRGAVKDKDSYPGHEMKKIVIPGIMNKWGKVTPCRMDQNKNVIAYLSGDYGTLSFLYDHNGTLEDSSDDKFVALQNLIDNNGDGVESLLGPGQFLEDSYDGSYIIGTANGIFTADRHDLFECDPPKITWLLPLREDGTMIGDFGSGTFTGAIGMAVDAENRKWFLFENGQLECLSPDRSTVIAEFNPQNSPIPATQYLGMVYVPDTNSLFIGSNRGLFEFCLEGGSSNHSSVVPSVYPRVAEAHDGGHINISGLEDSRSYILLGPDNTEMELPKSSLGRIQLHPKDYPAGTYRLQQYPEVEFIINQ